MTNAITFYFPDGRQVNYIVGEDNVKRIFQDEKSGNWIVLGDEIYVFSRIPCMSEKDYKEKK